MVTSSHLLFLVVTVASDKVERKNDGKKNSYLKPVNLTTK